MTPSVLIADKLHDNAVKIFEDRGIKVDVKVGLEKKELEKVIAVYDGLVVRSATQATAEIIKAGDRLKVIGRAGIGVDNIDREAATAGGIIVMNTPFGNSITTAEHAISLMLALARNIPAAHVSTIAGKWEKSKFTGIEITGKTLGIIGCGNIGAIVAARALGLKMKVLVYDPFLSSGRAFDLGVQKVELAELWARADFISLHTPLTDMTRNMIDEEALSKMRRGVHIINAARGGLIVEEDLFAALKSGHVAGAAIDVYPEEPALDNLLFGVPNMICTPHLGASTLEAQENVALQIAEQMSDYLLTGAITNALNFPAISAEEAPKLKPFIRLAEKLGSFEGQLTQSGLKSVRIEYAGEVSEMNMKALTAAALSGVLKPLLDDVNMVSAPILAKQRGIHIEELARDQVGPYDSTICVTLTTERQKRSVTGTVYADGKPRILQIKHIHMEAEFGPHMLYTENEDKPGYIGALGTELGRSGVNIATFSLGRSERGGHAIALVTSDEPIPEEVIENVRKMPLVLMAEPLRF